MGRPLPHVWTAFSCGVIAWRPSTLRAIKQSGYDPDDIYFRGLAYRMMWALHWDVSQDVLSFRYEGPSCEEDLPGAYHIALLHAYNQVEPFMRERAILPDEAGVLYCCSFAAGALGVPGHRRAGLDSGESIREVLSGEITHCAASREEELHLCDRIGRVGLGKQTFRLSRHKTLLIPREHKNIVLNRKKY